MAGRFCDCALAGLWSFLEVRPGRIITGHLDGASLARGRNPSTANGSLRGSHFILRINYRLAGLGVANGKANVADGEADGDVDSLGEDEAVAVGEGVGLGVGVGGGGIMFSQ
jgi:hypothetical protein